MPLRVKSAIKYNDRKHYPENYVKAVQALIGARSSGDWDCGSVTKLAKWQEDYGLVADGKLGPKTKLLIDKAIDERCPAPEPVESFPLPDKDIPPLELGVWFDHSIKHAAKNPERHARKLVSLGFSKVAIMLTSAGDGDHQHPIFKGTLEDTKKVCDAFKAAGLKVIFTFWPRPRRSYIDELFDRLEEYVKECRPYGIEPDVEGNWKSSYWKRFKEPRPFTSHEEAGDYLVLKMMNLKKAYGVIVGATTFAEHWELDKRAKASVLGKVDYAAIQCYSNWDGGDKAMGTRYAPDNFCKLGMDRALRVGIAPERCELAIAAWDQHQFPGLSPEDVMEMAVRCAVAQGVTKIWYWSYKWIAGIKSDDAPYAAPFIATLPKA